MQFHRMAFLSAALLSTPAAWSYDQRGNDFQPYGSAPPGYGYGRAHGYRQPARSEMPAAGNRFGINGMRFEPATLTVDKGENVTWMHSSSMPHSLL